MIKYSLDWFVDYLIKTSSKDTIINDLKSVTDFKRFFDVMTEKEKDKIEKLKKQLDNREIDKGYFNRITHVIKNKYFYPSDLFEEFYLYSQESLSDSIETVDFAQCSCMTFYHDGQSDPFTISVIKKCDNDGNAIEQKIFHEVYEGILQDYLEEINKRKGFDTDDGTYLIGKAITTSFDIQKQYVQSEIDRFKNNLEQEA